MENLQNNDKYNIYKYFKNLPHIKQAVKKEDYCLITKEINFNVNISRKMIKIMRKILNSIKAQNHNKATLQNFE